MLHAALQLHRRAPLDHLVLGHPVDPGGVCEDNWKAGTDPSSAHQPQCGHVVCDMPDLEVSNTVQSAGRGSVCGVIEIPKEFSGSEIQHVRGGEGKWVSF